MLYVPEIEPIRVKTEPINSDLVDPGLSSSRFPRDVGPRVIYLDGALTYPPQTSDDNSRLERERQNKIWKMALRGNDRKFIDRQADEGYDSSAVVEVKDSVYAELGTRHSAEFFERVYSQLFGKAMNVVIISAGVRMDGWSYREIGYRGR